MRRFSASCLILACIGLLSLPGAFAQTDNSSAPASMSGAAAPSFSSTVNLSPSPTDDQSSRAISIGVGPAQRAQPTATAISQSAAPQSVSAQSALSQPAAPSSNGAGKLFMIFVGVDKYPYVPQLRYAVSDTRRLAEGMIHTFHIPRENVHFLHDAEATRENIRRAMNQLANSDRVTPGDQVLFMFAGHGMTTNAVDGSQIGFLIPYDAEIDLSGANFERLITTCLPMDEMRRLARFIPARHTLFIVDACFGGLATQRSEPKSVPSLSLSYSLRSIQILTAGSKDQEILEAKSWGGSGTVKLLLDLFADAKRPEWQDGVLTAGEMGACIKYNLPRMVKDIRPEHNQTPQFERMEGMGEFFLARPGFAPAMLPAAEAAQKAGDRIEGPAGVFVRIESEVPPGSELSATDVRSLLAQALLENQFKIYDEESLAKAMRAGDDAPTRFLLRGKCSYILEKTDQDPFKTGRMASRARFSSSIEAIDTYTGRLAAPPLEMDVNRLVYLRDDIRDMILEEVKKGVAKLSKDLNLYVKPQQPADDRAGALPVCPVVFLDGKKTDASEILAREGIQPGVLRALNHSPIARLIPPEIVAGQIAALGLPNEAVVRADHKQRLAFLKAIQARYCIVLNSRTIGKMQIMDVTLFDGFQNGKNVASAPMKFDPAKMPAAPEDWKSIQSEAEKIAREKLVPKMIIAK